MSENQGILKVTPKTTAIDLLITIVVGYLFLLWFKPHVPSEDPSTIFWVAAFSAIPAAGTFWLCLQMFKVTLVHQRKLKEEKKD